MQLLDSFGRHVSLRCDGISSEIIRPCNDDQETTSISEDAQATSSSGPPDRDGKHENRAQIDAALRMLKQLETCLRQMTDIQMDKVRDSRLNLKA